MFIMEKIWENGDKIRSGVIYSTLGCEFSVNELTIYIKYDVIRQKHMEN